MTKIPKSDIKLATVLPSAVIGYTSPYPTVVRVVMAHQKAETIFGKTSGWASCSEKYISEDESNMSKKVTKAVIPSSGLLSFNT